MGRPFWTDYASGDLPNRRTIAHYWELVFYVSQILTCEWRWLILIPGKHGHHSTLSTILPKPALLSMVLNSARLPSTMSSNLTATPSISPAISSKAPYS